MHDVTRESFVAVTDHFAGAFVCENVARIYIWRCGNVMTYESLTMTPFCLEKSSVREGIINV